MNKQIEALRLTDAIQLGWLENVDPDKADIDMIQTELRRLHEVNADLLEALKAYNLKHRMTYGLDGAWDEELRKGEEAVEKAEGD